jgi:hypothetical protein
VLPPPPSVVLPPPPSVVLPPPPSVALPAEPPPPALLESPHANSRKVEITDDATKERFMAASSMAKSRADVVT